MSKKLKIIIIYGSTTGNTKIAADAIAKILSQKAEVNVKDVKEAGVQDINNYDILIIGSPTYNDGELQDDMAIFSKELKKLNLNNKKTAIFGLGDSMFPRFCGSADILEETIKSTKGSLIIPTLKIDGKPDESINLITKWAQELLQKL